MTSRRRTWPMSSKRANSRIGTWFAHHVYSFVASLGRVLRTPWATALTVGVIAVPLALPLGLWLALGNVERFSGSVPQSREVGSASGREGVCQFGLISVVRETIKKKKNKH